MAFNWFKLEVTYIFILARKPTYRSTSWRRTHWYFILFRFSTKCDIFMLDFSQSTADLIAFGLFQLHVVFASLFFCCGCIDSKCRRTRLIKIHKKNPFRAISSARVCMCILWLELKAFCRWTVASGGQEKDKKRETDTVRQLELYCGQVEEVLFFSSFSTCRSRENWFSLVVVRVKRTTGRNGMYIHIPRCICSYTCAVKYVSLSPHTTCLYITKQYIGI